jgi:hypothetical protein
MCGLPPVTGSLCTDCATALAHYTIRMPRRYNNSFATCGRVGCAECTKQILINTCTWTYVSWSNKVRHNIQHKLYEDQRATTEILQRASESAMLTTGRPVQAQGPRVARKCRNNPTTHNTCSSVSLAPLCVAIVQKTMLRERLHRELDKMLCGQAAKP